MSRSPWLTILLLSFAIAACTDSSLTVTDRSGPDFPDPVDTPSDDEPSIDVPEGVGLAGSPEVLQASAPSYRLAIRFDEAPEVGRAVPYTVQVFQGSLENTSAFTIDVTVTPDVDVEVTTTTMTFNVPGPYVVAAAATRDDIVVEGSIDITVGVGAPTTLTVSTDPEVAQAGQLIHFTVSATDAGGNPIDPATLGLDMWLEPGGATIDPSAGEFTLTEVGRYELHAETGTGLTAADIFHVIAADPIFIDLQLEEYDDLDPGDTLDYEVYAEDAYGNPVETLDIAVFTEPAGGVVESRRIEWPDEGVFDVVAQVVDTPLEDREGPVVIDGFGPIIAVKSPDRGTVQRTSTVHIRANVTDAASGVDRVEVNGVAVSLDGNGDFDYAMTSALGINLVEIDAWDVEGHHTDHVQSYMYGTSFYDQGQKIPSSLLARVNEGTLNMIEDWVEDEFDEQYLKNLILGIGSYGGCVDVINWPCAYINATDFDMTSLYVNIDPQSGYSDLLARIWNPDVRVHVTGTVSLWGNVTASRADVTGRLYLSANSSTGEISATLTNVGVNLVSFHIDLDAIPSYLSFIEDWISDWVESDVEAAMRTAIINQVPPEIDAALSELEIGTTIDVLGTMISIDAIPQSITTQTTGITLTMGTIVESDTIDPDMEGEGALRTWSPTPTYGSTPGFVLSISDDFLNQALYAMWESGNLNQLFVDYLMPEVDTSALSALVPGSDGMEFEVDPILPPVFRPGTTGGGYGEFQIGDALIDIYATYPRSSRTLVARVAVSAFARANVSIDTDNTVQVSFVGEPEFDFDGLVSTIPNLRSEDLADLLEALIPVMIPELLDGVQEFPIPSFQGFTISSPTVSLAGSYGDFLNVAGDLVAQ